MLLNDYIDKNYSDKKTHLLFSSTAGALNGIMIFVLTLVYDIVAEKVVNWENHKYESDRENSLILKSFVFNFVVSYITLFHKAFFNFTEKNKKTHFEALGTNFVSIVFSKSLAFTFTSNILPYIIYRLKKRRLLKKWKPKRKLLKAEFVR